MFQIVLVKVEEVQDSCTIKPNHFVLLIVWFEIRARESTESFNGGKTSKEKASK
jgi:hypothetical protein